jgi:hypothetical protein
MPKPTRRGKFGISATNRAAEDDLVGHDQIALDATIR